MGCAQAVGFSLVIGLTTALPGLHAATAAHAQVGTPVANVRMPGFDGGTNDLLRDGDVNVLVFVRPNERSLAAMKELARCKGEITSRSIPWTAVVSDSVPAQSAAEILRDSGLDAPAVRDTGDAVYGALGISLHPVVVLVSRDRRLAAFEPFRAVNYCSVVKARIRRTLGEISDEEMDQALNPPKSETGGNGQAAKRYRALAEAQFRAKDYDKALRSVRTSLERDPTLAIGHALLAEILAAQGNCEGAMSAYAKAQTLDPGSVQRADTGRCQK